MSTSSASKILWGRRIVASAIRGAHFFRFLSIAEGAVLLLNHLERMEVAARSGPPAAASPLSAQTTVDLGSSTGCSPTSPGYVWAAESSSSLKGADPLKGGGPALTGFSAVPVTLVAP
jgi:hypothetical protein